MNTVQLYLEEFIQTFAEIYGIETVTHYVHALQHLVKLAQKHGSLDNFSAYLMESYLGTFKHFKHGPKNPGQQVTNRIIERQVASRDIYIRNKRCKRFSNDFKYDDGPFPSNLRKENFKTYSQINLEHCSINV